MKYLAVLGRQPELSIAELEAHFFGVERIAENLAIFDTNNSEAELPNIDRFGGALKFAVEMNEAPKDYLAQLPDGKIVLGVSDYGAIPNANSRKNHGVNSRADSRKSGFSARKDGSKKRAFEFAKKLKRELTRRGRSVRILPNKTATISTAAAIHNRLGRKENRVELLLVGDRIFRSIGSQNIDAYARRDQGRPARDARVGMLPPKLAQILINLCGPLKNGATVLDAFCGTGVVLQEALLMGYNAYGSDLSEKMVQYSKRNLEALRIGRTNRERENVDSLNFRVETGDAMEKKWEGRISAVVSEIYLGRPFSQAPSERTFREEKENCKTILIGLLKNLAMQVEAETPVVLAVPAWLRSNGKYEKLITGENALDEIKRLGYNVQKSGSGGLVYARPGQIVAREILILRKS